jgi:hypothetical protein
MVRETCEGVIGKLAVGQWISGWAGVDVQRLGFRRVESSRVWGPKKKKVAWSRTGAVAVAAAHIKDLRQGGR